MILQSVTTTLTIMLLVRILPLLLLISQHSLKATSSVPLPTYHPSPPLSISFSSNSVALHENVTIRCRVNPNSEEGVLMAQSSMNLYCPVTSSNTFCFQDCRPLEECKTKADCRIIPTLKGVECRRIIEASGEIVTEYKVKRVTPEWIDWQHPGFACHSATGKTDWVRLRVPFDVEGNSSSLSLAASEESPASAATATTTATPEPRKTSDAHGVETTTTKAVISPSSIAYSSMNWLNFLQRTSSGGFWTPETVIVFAFVALALSLLINCFCYAKWSVRRHHKNTRKLKENKSFSGQIDFKAGEIMPSIAWYSSNRRFITPGTLIPGSQSVLQRSIAIPDESSISNPPAGCTSESVETACFQVGEKIINRSTLSHSVCRNSDSGFSFVNVATPQSTQSLSNPTFPTNWEPCGWSGPATPRIHRPQFHFVPSHYVGMQGPSSREAVLSEWPMSDICFEPTPRHHYFPVVVDPGGGVRASQPKLVPATAHSVEMGFIEKTGTVDGARAGDDSCSSEPRMALLLPVEVVSHPYSMIPLPSSSTDRSSVPLLKTGVTSEKTAVVNETMGKNAAEVRMWLQLMPTNDRDHRPRLPTKLADSLNTEYDLASDWSEREPMPIREKPSSEATAPAE